MDCEQLKSLIRTAPTKQSTLEELEPELLAAEAHVLSLRAQCDSLLGALRAIEDARKQLKANSTVIPNTEPARESPDDVVEADKLKPTRSKRTNP